MKIIHMEQNHWSQVREIYKECIVNQIVTMNKKVPTWEEWDRGHLPIVRLVAIENEEIFGWLALSAKSFVAAYKGYVEESVYVSIKHQGNGIGRALIASAIKQSEDAGIWTLEAHIMEENIASIAVHEKMGFRKVGWREKIGKLNGEWKNTILYERRSRVVR